MTDVVSSENISVESNINDHLDGSSNHDDGESYHPPDSIKSEETDTEWDNKTDEINEDDDSRGTLDDMEGTVIHFLAEKSIRKTRVKSGIKSACRFKCDNCTSIFRYKSTLNYHLKSECGRKVIKGKALVEKQPGKVSCNVCGKALCSRTSLMVHMRIHTGERPFVCPECGRSFFQKAHLRDHRSKMHTASSALCRLCNSTFQDKYHLHLHMREHRQVVAPFACKVCDESFSTRSSLSNHMSGRHGEEAPSTDLAGKPCGKRTRLPIDPEETRCYECGRTYSGPRQLRAHVRRSHRASLPCPHCPRLFPSGYDLRVHTRSHTGERPYSCDFCDRTFSRKSILDVHRTLHTGQKDFVCSVCSKAFNRKSKLQVHFTEHTRQTVKCQVCQKEFKCQSYLTSHMKIHTEEAAGEGKPPEQPKPPAVKKRKRAVPPLTPIRSLRGRKIAHQPSQPSKALSPPASVTPLCDKLVAGDQLPSRSVTPRVPVSGIPLTGSVTPEYIEVSPEIKLEVTPDIKTEGCSDDELPLDCSIKSE